MSLDWTEITQTVIAGAAVSWPVFAAGIWISHRRIREHVDDVTGDQTGQLKKITDQQTGILLHRLGPEYHGHEQRER